MRCRDLELSCLCRRQPSFHMRLRGLCANSAIDKYYQPMNDFHNIGRLQLIGHTMSTIEYDDMNKYWKMSLAWSNVSGLSHAAKNTFALGKQSWSITGDTGCKADGKENTVLLKLTGCHTTGQFTCDDGQCVPMEQRCNQLPECRDFSDEKNCMVLVLRDGYNNKTKMG